MARGTHPVRVFVSSSLTEAELCVGYLRGEGIEAEMENPATHTVLHGIEKILDGEEGFGVIVTSKDEARAVTAVASFRERDPLEDEEEEDEEDGEEDDDDDDEDVDEDEEVDDDEEEEDDGDGEGDDEEE